jgi:hypothetical protein
MMGFPIFIAICGLGLMLYCIGIELMQIRKALQKIADKEVVR